LRPIGDDESLQVIIETPKGAATNIVFDPKHKIFALDRPSMERLLAQVQT
jgi:inorganic pyrophosphatase